MLNRCERISKIGNIMMVVGIIGILSSVFFFSFNLTGLSILRNLYENYSIFISILMVSLFICMLGVLQRRYARRVKEQMRFYE